jgi:hypothetical protein
MESDKLKIFDNLKLILAQYTPPFCVVNDLETRYELSSKKQVVVDGKNKDEVYFGAVMIHGGHVGFYMMSAYLTNLADNLRPELKKCLKGKSCFHIKKIDDVLLIQIKAFTAISYQYYQQQDWV